MVAFTQRCAFALAALTTAASALDGIVAPSEVTAGQSFKITFQDANDDQYRVYLAASLAGSNGPTCAYFDGSISFFARLTISQATSSTRPLSAIP